MLVQQCGRFNIFGTLTFRIDLLAIVDGADRRVGNQAADDVDTGSMRQIDMVDSPQMTGTVGHAGCRPSRSHSRTGVKTENSLKRGVALDPIAETARDDGRIVGEPSCAIPVGPAPQIVQRLRQIQW